MSTCPLKAAGIDVRRPGADRWTCQFAGVTYQIRRSTVSNMGMTDYFIGRLSGGVFTAIERVESTSITEPKWRLLAHITKLADQLARRP